MGQGHFALNTCRHFMDLVNKVRVIIEQTDDSAINNITKTNKKLHQTNPSL